MSVNGDEPQVIMPTPRPLSYSFQVIEGASQDADGNTKMVKLIQHTIFHENGMDVHFYEAEFAGHMLNALSQAFQEAKSPLTIAKDLPRN